MSAKLIIQGTLCLPTLCILHYAFCIKKQKPHPEAPVFKEVNYEKIMVSDQKIGNLYS